MALYHNYSMAVVLFNKIILFPGCLKKENEMFGKEKRGDKMMRNGGDH